MDVSLVSSNGMTYIDLCGSSFSIRQEGELLELLSLVYLHESNRILMDAQNLSDEFFNLKSGLAGAAMQKFANYGVKVAVLLPENADHNLRFKELMYEMNASNQVRFYVDRESAETWLTAP